jgi:pimeloyl-ACP methyl ester carboxylesterase
VHCRCRAALASAALCILTAACSAPRAGAFGGSRESVEAWSAPRGYHAEVLDAGAFRLFTLLRKRAAAETIAVYIEGDGAPWTNSYQPPRDPTPIRPLALALAVGDAAPVTAYLGRPCQYLDEAGRSACDVSYWTSRRFAPEVLDAMNGAVSRLKSSAGARRVRLVGYSGGGVVAALLAGRRNDVESLVTVAAPLALGDWIALHGLSPLERAYDPLEARGNLPAQAVHFAGARDEVVPPGIVERFVRRRGGRLEVIAGFDHDCCWARDWAALLRRGGIGERMP